MRTHKNQTLVLKKETSTTKSMFRPSIIFFSLLFHGIGCAAASLSSDFPDVIRCAQHYYYLSKLRSGGTEALYFNNIVAPSRYAVVSQGKIVEADSPEISDCVIGKTIAELAVGGNVFNLRAKAVKNPVESSMTAGFPDVIRCENSFFYFTSTELDLDANVPVLHYTSQEFPLLLPYRFFLMGVLYSGWQLTPIRQSLIISEGRRVIGGNGGDVGDCLERSMEELYSIGRAFNIVGSKKLDGDSIIPGFPDVVRCGHIIYYLHAAEDGQIKYYNQAEDGNFAFDRNTKRSLGINLPDMSCENRALSEFFDGSNSLYEAFNVMPDRSILFDISITNFQFEDILVRDIDKEKIVSHGSVINNKSRGTVTKTMTVSEQLSNDLTIGFDRTLARSSENTHAWNVNVGLSYKTTVKAGVEGGASFLGTGGKVTAEVSTEFGATLDVGYSGSYVTSNQESVTDSEAKTFSESKSLELSSEVSIPAYTCVIYSGFCDKYENVVLPFIAEYSISASNRNTGEQLFGADLLDEIREIGDYGDVVIDPADNTKATGSIRGTVATAVYINCIDNVNEHQNDDLKCMGADAIEDNEASEDNEPSAGNETFAGIETSAGNETSVGIETSAGNATSAGNEPSAGNESPEGDEPSEGDEPFSREFPSGSSYNNLSNGILFMATLGWFLMFLFA